jgi:hypothetical protein
MSTQATRVGSRSEEPSATEGPRRQAFPGRHGSVPDEETLITGGRAVLSGASMIYNFRHRCARASAALAVADSWPLPETVGYI